MARRLAFALVAATVLTGSASVAFADGPADEVIALERHRSAAIGAHDMAFLDAVYAEEFRGVTATGFVVDKARLMKVFGLDNPDTVFAIDQLEARIYGDTAVQTGRLTGRDKTGKIVSQSLYTHVWVRKDGRWRLVAGEGTDIPAERRS